VWLASKGHGVALVVAMVAVFLLARKGSLPAAGYRRITIHTHGGHGLRVAARHEAGHVLMAKAVGARVHSAEIHPDGSGRTRLDIPVGIEPKKRIAIDVAGEVASGTSAGCGSDHGYRDALLATLPASARGGEKRGGYALARRHVGGLFFDGGVSSLADRIQKKGHVKF
jgi:hypothetical protein